MPLSCECYEDHEYYFNTPKDYTTLRTKKRKRCDSCKELINLNSICVEFECWRTTRSDIEERIYGDEYYLAPIYLCEECGDIYFSLSELGFCVVFGDHTMKDLLDEYHADYLMGDN